MQVTLYHNPRCSKSREALQLLQEKGISPDVVLYMDTPLTVSALSELVQRIGITPRQLLRTREDEYKTLDLANPALTDEQILQAMIDHPRLMERPIAVAGSRAVIGRPPEAILALL